MFYFHRNILWWQLNCQRLVCVSSHSCVLKYVWHLTRQITLSVSRNCNKIHACKLDSAGQTQQGHWQDCVVIKEGGKQEICPNSTHNTFAVCLHYKYAAPFCAGFLSSVYLLLSLACCCSTSCFFFCHSKIDKKTQSIFSNVLAFWMKKTSMSELSRGVFHKPTQSILKVQVAVYV